MSGSAEELFAGGVAVRGHIAVAGPPADDQTAWLNMQPNHSRVVSWVSVETPLGSGRVYTLARDRDLAVGAAGGLWRAQYAYIPAGEISYEL